PSTSFIVAGVGVGAHSALPLSSASMIIFSSHTICHAISRAVRDLGSGRYSDPSGILAKTLRVVLDSLTQKSANRVLLSMGSPQSLNQTMSAGVRRTCPPPSPTHEECSA